MNDSGDTQSAKIKDSFELHLEKTSEMVRSWPEWKKCIIGSSEPSAHKCNGTVEHKNKD